MYKLIVLLTMLLGESTLQRDARNMVLPLQCSGSTGYCYCYYERPRVYFRMADSHECPTK